jgi:hypothetical protein
MLLSQHQCGRAAHTYEHPIPFDRRTKRCRADGRHCTQPLQRVMRRWSRRCWVLGRTRTWPTRCVCMWLVVPSEAAEGRSRLAVVIRTRTCTGCDLSQAIDNLRLSPVCMIHPSAAVTASMREGSPHEHPFPFDRGTKRFRADGRHCTQPLKTAMWRWSRRCWVLGRTMTWPTRCVCMWLVFPTRLRRAGVVWRW